MKKKSLTKTDKESIQQLVKSKKESIKYCSKAH